VKLGAVLDRIVNDFLFHFYGPAGYVGVFSLLVACGLGVPLPEDIALIGGGILAGIGPPRGVGSVWLMMVVGLAGILVGDSIIFKAGKDHGDALLDTRLGKHIKRDQVDKVRDLFAKHGSKFIMVARFIPGVRAVTYFVAGSSKVPYYVFALYDGLAALLSAPVWVYLGFWMYRHHAMRRAQAIAHKFQLTLISIIAVVVVVGLTVFLVRRRKARIAAAQTRAAPLIAAGEEEPPADPPAEPPAEPPAAPPADPPAEPPAARVHVPVPPTPSPGA
jgi:membrane protein DedA with SNARE-associated domain